MVDLNQLRKRKPGTVRLGLDTETPLQPAATRGVLEAPEHAPSAPVEPGQTAAAVVVAPTANRVVAEGRNVRTSANKYYRPDLKTNRTVSFSTKVTQATLKQIHSLAKRDGVLLCEIIEKGIELYEQESLRKSGLS